MGSRRSAARHDCHAGRLEKIEQGDRSLLSSLRHILARSSPCHAWRKDRSRTSRTSRTHYSPSSFRVAQSSTPWTPPLAALASHATSQARLRGRRLLVADAIRESARKTLAYRSYGGILDGPLRFSFGYSAFRRRRSAPTIIDPAVSESVADGSGTACSVT